MTKRACGRIAIGSLGELKNGPSLKDCGPHRLDQGDAAEHQGMRWWRQSSCARAQTAAEAAMRTRKKWTAVISTLRRGSILPGAPRCWRNRQGSIHLLLVCTGERASVAFNSSIVRLSLERALALINQGKESNSSASAAGV